MGQMEMKCILYFYMDQSYSGERCGPWALLKKAIDDNICKECTNFQRSADRNMGV
jgi:hypothetical protein